MYSLNSRDLFLNLRRLDKMTKPLRFENKSLRLKYKCLICIWIIFWAILDLFINPKYLFQNKSFSQTYYFKSEKSFVILTSLLGLKINPGNLESKCAIIQTSKVFFFFFFFFLSNHWFWFVDDLNEHYCFWTNLLHFTHKFISSVGKNANFLFKTDLLFSFSFLSIQGFHYIKTWTDRQQ